MTAGRSAGLAYWLVVALLVVIGLLGIGSFGFPFLIAGVTMLVVGPWRRRPAILWPTLAGMLGFVAGYVLTVPTTCSSSAAEGSGGGSLAEIHDACTGLIGIEYPGNASWTIGVWWGLAAGIVAALLVLWLVRRLARTRAPAAA